MKDEQSWKNDQNFPLNIFKYLKFFPSFALSFIPSPIFSALKLDSFYTFLNCISCQSNVQSIKITTLLGNLSKLSFSWHVGGRI